MLNSCKKILKCNARRKRLFNHTKGKQKSTKSAAVVDDDDDDDVEEEDNIMLGGIGGDGGE